MLFERGNNALTIQFSHQRRSGLAERGHTPNRNRNGSAVSTKIYAHITHHDGIGGMIENHKVILFWLYFQTKVVLLGQ